MATDASLVGLVHHRLNSPKVDKKSSPKVFFSPHIPKAKTSSSLRCQAAEAASEVLRKNFTPSTHKSCSRRTQRKMDKLLLSLLSVCPDAASPKALTKLELENAYFFADGGNKNNQRFIPPVFPGRPSKVLQLCQGDLYIPRNHLSNPSLGLTMELSQGPKLPFILVPRNEALKVKNLGPTLCQSFSAAILSQPGTFLRGKKIKIVREPRRKYSCIGSTAARGHAGVNAYNQSLCKMPKDQQQVLLEYFNSCEHLTKKYLPSQLINQAIQGIKLTKAQTFTLPAFDKWSAEIYGAIAVGVNVVLSAHSDADFIFSLTSIHTHEEYTERILVYFCFPTLGVAVPLRAGDQLLFDPTTPHMISSRCESEDDIYCTSLYLKTNVVGKNDNSLPLTEQQLSVLHNK